VTSKQKIAESKEQHIFSIQSAEIIQNTILLAYKKCRETILFPTCIDTLSDFLGCLVEEKVVENL